MKNARISLFALFSVRSLNAAYAGDYDTQTPQDQIPRPIRPAITTMIEPGEPSNVRARMTCRGHNPIRGQQRRTIPTIDSTSSLNSDSVMDEGESHQ